MPTSKPPAATQIEGWGKVIAQHAPQALRTFDAALPSPSHAASENGQHRVLKLVFSVRRHAKAIAFTFTLSGRVPADLESLVLPELSSPTDCRRRDELWKSTCLEIFVAPSGQSSYLELNLSPSGDWNVYAFDAYRSGMRPVEHAVVRVDRVERTADSISWHAHVASAMTPTGEQSHQRGRELALLLDSPALVMGATAVVEAKTGEKDYWALAHAGPKPDFHLRESFRLTL